MPRRTAKISDFLFKNKDEVSPGLVNDSPSMLVKILSMSVVLFLLLDCAIIVFYVKTNGRLDRVMAANYTQIIVNSMETSQRRHEDYTRKTLKMMTNDQENLRSFITDILFFAKEIEKLETSHIELASLSEFDQVFSKIAGSKTLQIEELRRAIAVFERVEREVKQLNDYLMPIDLYDQTQENVQKAERDLSDNLANIMKGFLDNIVRVDEVHGENQNALRRDIEDTMQVFDHQFARIYDKSNFKSVISSFTEHFEIANNSFLLFNTEYKPNVFGSQLTRDREIEVSSKRAFLCTIQVFASSDSSFNVALEYIDKGDPDKEGSEVIVWESYRIKGGPGNPFTYNEIQTFDLLKGKHTLYLRVIEREGASNLLFQHLKFDCMSLKPI